MAPKGRGSMGNKGLHGTKRGAKTGKRKISSNVAADFVANMNCGQPFILGVN